MREHAARPALMANIGALILGIRTWGPLYCINNTEPQNSIGNYLGPYSTGIGTCM